MVLHHPLRDKDLVEALVVRPDGLEHGLDRAAGGGGGGLLVPPPPRVLGEEAQEALSGVSPGRNRTAQRNVAYLFFEDISALQMPRRCLRSKSGMCARLLAENCDVLCPFFSI